MRNWIIHLRELVLTSPGSSPLSGKADVKLWVPGQDFSTGFRMSRTASQPLTGGSPKCLNGEGFTLGKVTWTALVFPRLFWKKLFSLFAPGKMLVAASRRAEPESSCSQYPSLPHLRRVSIYPIFWCPNPVLGPLPALPPAPLQDHPVPFLPQPSPLWLLLFCPVNQPVCFRLVTLWLEVGSRTDWWVPLGSQLFLFVFPVVFLMDPQEHAECLVPLVPEGMISYINSLLRSTSSVQNSGKLRYFW